MSWSGADLGRGTPASPRTLAYELRGAAGPFRSAAGRWTLHSGSGTTTVEVTGTFQPHNWLVGKVVGPLARAVAKRAARRALADLAGHLTGRARDATDHSGG